MACHNLCKFRTPPPNYRSLLGLGLKFIPIPRWTTCNIDDYINRFTRDIYIRIFFAHHEDTPAPELYCGSNWNPSTKAIPDILINRVGRFATELRTHFVKRKAPSNLLPFQRRLLQEFRNSKEFTVFTADKNLGLCITERETYIERCLHDHLYDKSTYQQLTRQEAILGDQALSNALDNWQHIFEDVINDDDKKYFARSLAKIDPKNPFSKFYITGKVHKSPWTSRPVVSTVEHRSHPFARWADKRLREYVVNTKCYTKSSFEYQQMITSNARLPPNARFFTADAVSMYTNIDTQHALTVIEEYLELREPNKLLLQAIMSLLKIIMENNYFQFGDTYWLQIDGTAMGTPVACAWAQLYFAAKEEKMLKDFTQIYSLFRFIDDFNGIWILPDGIGINDDIQDDPQWLEFQQELNIYGKLKWKFSPLKRKAVFLDLNLKMTEDGRIITSIFEKSMNLYQYLPPHSNHSYGCLKGLITGSILRSYKLNSETSDRHKQRLLLFRRLLARGYKRKQLIKLFEEANKHAIRTLSLQPQDNAPSENKSQPLFFHLPFHRSDPRANIVQQLFTDIIFSPPIGQGVKFTEIPNKTHRARPRASKLIVAYHSTPNLKNILSSRLVTADKGPPVSAFIATKP